MGITKEDLEKLKEEWENKRGAVPEVYFVSKKQYDLMKKREASGHG